MADVSSLQRGGGRFFYDTVLRVQSEGNTGIRRLDFSLRIPAAGETIPTVISR